MRRFTIYHCACAALLLLAVASSAQNNDKEGEDDYYYYYYEADVKPAVVKPVKLPAQGEKICDYQLEELGPRAGSLKWPPASLYECLRAHEFCLGKSWLTDRGESETFSLPSAPDLTLPIRVALVRYGGYVSYENFRTMEEEDGLLAGWCLRGKELTMNAGIEMYNKERLPYFFAQWKRDPSYSDRSESTVSSWLLGNVRQERDRYTLRVSWYDKKCREGLEKKPASKPKVAQLAPVCKAGPVRIKWVADKTNTKDDAAVVGKQRSGVLSGGSDEFPAYGAGLIGAGIMAVLCLAVCGATIFVMRRSKPAATPLPMTPRTLGGNRSRGSASKKGSRRGMHNPMGAPRSVLNNGYRV